MTSDRLPRSTADTGGAADSVDACDRPEALRGTARHPVRRIAPLLAALLALALAGCGDFDRGEDVAGAPEGPPAANGGDGGDGGDGDAARWADDVHPLLIERCTACHTANFASMPLTGDPDVDFGPVTSQVTPGDPDGSRLLQKAIGELGHGGGETLRSPVDDGAIETISSWIAVGAEP